MITRVMTGLLALSLILSAHFVGERAEACRYHEQSGEDLMYLPAGHILRLAAFGHRNFLADIVWLSAIQYYGEQKLSGRNYEQAERLFQAIYDLDPYFDGATRFGALVLAQDAGNAEGGVALLDRAARDHPDDWRYPFDRGFIQQTVQKDYEAAGLSYRAASELPGAPDIAIRLAGVSFARLGDRDASRDVWNSVLEETENEVLARIAVRSLKNLDMEDAQDALTDAIATFREHSGRMPDDFTELVAVGVLPALPVDPWGGQFFYDVDSEKVYATTHVDRRMAQDRDGFQGLVNRYHAERGTWPRTLAEVVEAGYAKFEPWKPFGVELQYDPATGRVAWNPPWAPTEPRNHGESPA